MQRLVVGRRGKERLPTRELFAIDPNTIGRKPRFSAPATAAPVPVPVPVPVPEELIVVDEDEEGGDTQEETENFAQLDIVPEPEPEEPAEPQDSRERVTDVQMIAESVAKGVAEALLDKKLPDKEPSEREQNSDRIDRFVESLSGPPELLDELALNLRSRPGEEKSILLAYQSSFPDVNLMDLWQGRSALENVEENDSSSLSFRGKPIRGEEELAEIVSECDRLNKMLNPQSFKVLKNVREKINSERRETEREIRVPLTKKDQERIPSKWNYIPVTKKEKVLQDMLGVEMFPREQREKFEHVAQVLSEKKGKVSEPLLKSLRKSLEENSSNYKNILKEVKEHSFRKVPDGYVNPFDVPELVFTDDDISSAVLRRKKPSLKNKSSGGGDAECNSLPLDSILRDVTDAIEMYQTFVANWDSKWTRSFLDGDGGDESNASPEFISRVEGFVAGYKSDCLILSQPTNTKFLGLVKKLYELRNTFLSPTDSSKEYRLETLFGLDKHDPVLLEILPRIQEQEVVFDGFVDGPNVYRLDVLVEESRRSDPEDLRKILIAFQKCMFCHGSLVDEQMIVSNLVLMSDLYCLLIDDGSKIQIEAMRELADNLSLYPDIFSFLKNSFV